MPSTLPGRNRTWTLPTPWVIEIPELPEYEPPSAPLTAESQRNLAQLMESQLSRQLKTHLQHAAEKLTDSAGDVNEKLSDARVRYERAKEKRRGVGDSEDVDVEPDDENEEYQRLAETERKVDGVTGRMEEKMRLIIDSEARLQGLKDAMEAVDRELTEAQHATLGARQTRGQRRRQREAESVDEDGEAEDDGDYEGTPEREARETNAQHPPSHRLVNALDEGTEKWNGQSLTARYVPCSSTCMGSRTNFGVVDAGTPVTITTLVSIALYTIPSSPATKYHPSHTPLHGFHIWKTPMQTQTQCAVRRVDALATSANHHPQAQTTLPSRGSVFH